jgi:hypothetical protein
MAALTAAGQVWRRHVHGMRTLLAKRDAACMGITALLLFATPPDLSSGMLSAVHPDCTLTPQARCSLQTWGLLTWSSCCREPTLGSWHSATSC